MLTLPAAAVKRGKEAAYVLISRGKDEKPEERKVETGVSDDNNVEIVSGLTADDKVLMVTQKYKVSSSKAGTNPLNPMARKR